jgi:hypothetical protein
MGDWRAAPLLAYEIDIEDVALTGTHLETGLGFKGTGADAVRTLRGFWVKAGFF